MHSSFVRIFLASFIFISSACTHSPPRSNSSPQANLNENEVRTPASAKKFDGTLEKVPLDKTTREYKSQRMQELLSQGDPATNQCKAFEAYVDGTHKDATIAGEKFDTFGIIVAKENGEVLWEKYYKETQPQTLFRMYSVSKLFTVLSYGNLELDGTLSRDELVSKYLGGAMVGYKYNEDLNIDHLLTMASGVPWCEYVSCSGRDALAMTYSLGRNDLVDYYFKNATKPDAKLSKPGEKYTYSAGNSSIIQAIIKTKLGHNYLTYPMDRILRQLGENRYAFESDPKGVYLGGSGLFLTTQAFAKLGLVLANKGKYGDKEIVSEDFFNAMTGDSLPALKNSKDANLKNWEGPTGMGVWLNNGSYKDGNGKLKFLFPSFMPDAPQNMIYGSGLQGKRLLIFPEDSQNKNDGIVIARVGVENNHSAFWAPFSKIAYNCFKNDPNTKTPNQIAKEERERDPNFKAPEAASSAPILTTPKEDAEAIFDLVKHLVPLKIAAIELCNCAFVSNFLKSDQSGNPNVEATLSSCKDYSKIDFSILGPLAPKILPDNVVITNSSAPQEKSVSYSYFGPNSQIKNFTAKASFAGWQGANGTCQISQEPKGLTFLTEAHFNIIWNIYNRLPDKKDKALLQKALNQGTKFIGTLPKDVKSAYDAIRKWIDDAFSEARRHSENQ